MDVEVGSFSDPPHLFGLAHFLEHMLFLGTAKYPDEASYNNFLSLHGGSSNAYTASENTNFHFDLSATRQPDAAPNFREALDRFAQFFIAPSFTASATDRELEAVHSEFEKNLQSDSWRGRQVAKAEANSSHPYSYFNIGSRETLQEIPEKDGIDIRKELLDFHAKYYSANLMKLAVVAPYDLDTMQEWVVELFSPVDNREVDFPWRAYQNIPPLLPDQSQRMFEVQTINDVRLLEVNWVTPSVLEDFRGKPASLLSNLLGDEGEGSIQSLLKARDWGDQVSAGMITERTFAMQYVCVTLTKKGLEHIDDTIQVVYDYIRLLKKSGVPLWLFNEEATVAENAFRFRERESPDGLAIQLASAQHYMPPEDCISGMYLYSEYVPEKFMRLLDCLTPENANIVLSGQFVGEKADKKEKWFGAMYHVEKVDNSRLRRWRNTEEHEQLSLPKPNDFIPTDFTVLGAPLPDGEADDAGPRPILRTSRMEIHHKLDRTFNRPKAVIYLKMVTPLTNQSPWHVVMSALFNNLLEDALTEHSSIAERAGFSYSFDVYGEGLQLCVIGYSHRIGDLLKDVVEKMKAFQADPVRFDMIMDFLERSYANFDKSPPTRHADYSLACMLYEPYWDIKGQFDCLKDGSVTLDVLNKYSRQLARKLFVTGLVYGNISEESAIEMMKTVEEVLDCQPLPSSQRIQRRVVQVPLGGNVFSRQPHPNQEDKNSAIDIYYQTEHLGNFPADVKIDLLTSILEDPMFHELRTVQQLGYIVQEGLCYRDSVGGVYFQIQSTVQSPDELLRRIDKFLFDVRQGLLESMPDEKFQTYVTALIASRSEPDKRLYSRASRFWGELGTGYLQYDRAQKEIEALKLVTKADVVQVFDEFIAADAPKRRRVVAQVYGGLHPFSEREPLPQGAFEVRDPVAFRRQSVLHPTRGVHKPHISSDNFQLEETDVNR